MAVPAPPFIRLCIAGLAIVTFGFYFLIDCGVAKPTVSASHGSATAIGQGVGSVSARTRSSQKTKAGK